MVMLEHEEPVILNHAQQGLVRILHAAQAALLFFGASARVQPAGIDHGGISLVARTGAISLVARTGAGATVLPARIDHGCISLVAPTGAGAMALAARRSGARLERGCSRKGSCISGPRQEEAEEARLRQVLSRSRRSPWKQSRRTAVRLHQPAQSGRWPRKQWAGVRPHQVRLHQPAQSGRWPRQQEQSRRTGVRPHQARLHQPAQSGRWPS